MIANAWVRQWAPWYGGDRTTTLINAVLRKPMKWTADKLAQRIGLDYATRTRLAITTIGAVDFAKAQRVKRRRKLNNARKRMRRAEAGAKPRAMSEARLKPWIALGISESTYRRRKRQHDNGDSNSGTACPKGVMMRDGSLSTSAQPPPKGGAYARAVPALSDVDGVFDTERVYPDRILLTAASERKTGRQLPLNAP